MSNSLGDQLRSLLRKCRNCGKVGAPDLNMWPWKMYHVNQCALLIGTTVHGVCSQVCNDRFASRLMGEWKDDSRL